MVDSLSLVDTLTRRESYTTNTGMAGTGQNIPCLQRKNRKNWELVSSAGEWTHRHMRFAGAHTATSAQSDRRYGGLSMPTWTT